MELLPVCRYHLAPACTQQRSKQAKRLQVPKTVRMRTCMLCDCLPDANFLIKREEMLLKKHLPSTRGYQCCPALRGSSGVPRHVTRAENGES
jgi:hypothetical protein